MVLRSLVPVVAIILSSMVALDTIQGEDNVPAVWERAEARGRLHRESLRRVNRVLQAWLKKINPRDGTVLRVGLKNPNKGANANWGYTCNTHCTYDMVTGGNRYGDRIERALAALPKHGVV